MSKAPSKNESLKLKSILKPQTEPFEFKKLKNKRAMSILKVRRVEVKTEVIDYSGRKVRFNDQVQVKEIASYKKYNR